MSDFYIFPKPRRRVPQALGLLGTLCLLGLVPVGTAQAACDSESPVYCIDGTVPNDGETLYQDKYGNVKELGPLNSNTTKVGVINTDALPTLGLTNPNAQVDLRNVWIDSAKDPTTKDIWLYFGWERDSTSGSGFISLEAQQAKPPAACDYTKSDADLIASCNPWAGRQAKDFLILWDQSGSSTAIILRYFNGTSFDAGITLPAELAVATYSPDGSRGELALNLTQAVFKGQACTSIANILPGTVTGNSDTADYKDWVPLTAPTISSCATVTVKKVTNPTGSTQDFSFTPALTLIPADRKSVV